MSVGDQSLTIGSFRIIRAFAAFDLIVTGLLASPITAHVFVRLLYVAESEWLGDPSASTEPVIPAIGWLFINIAGVLGVLWAMVRLVMPSRELALADAAGRFVVAALIVYYSLDGSVPAVLLAFAATELLGTVVQFWCFGRLPDQQTSAAR